MRIVALILLLVSLPLWLIIAILIFFQSGSQVIYKQIRVGVNRSEFVIYKFKTMENNKVTLVGKILRKLGLDELPQLVNIIKGDMVFVGPRPLTPFDVQRLGWDSLKYDARWSVKPGITGNAQLSKVCDAQVSMQSDLWYIEHKSYFLDARIILKSIFVPVIGKRTN